jgi:hypothetical protein
MNLDLLKFYKTLPFFFMNQIRIKFSGVQDYFETSKTT